MMGQSIPKALERTRMAMNMSTRKITAKKNHAPILSTHLPPVQSLFRDQLRSRPANGHTAFIPHIRKLVLEYCDKWPLSANARTYLLNQLQPLARSNPHVEVVVKQQNHREPVVRGFYSNALSCHACVSYLDVRW